MEQVIKTIGIERRFRSCEALRGVDMAIPEGQIVGLLGPNASGKTTLLKIMAGLLQPSAGQVVYPNNARPGADARATIGFCPDTMLFPRWMKVCDAHRFYEDMYPDYSPERADELIKLLELDDLRGTYVRSLSKGMRERLVLSLTYARETKLYLLDEPLDGIDPVGKTKVIDAILAMQPDGSSTLISTHQVKDIERILDSVFFLSKGKVIYESDCDTIREQQGKTVEQAYLEVFLQEGSLV